jgi:hypothetical protein
MASFNASRLGGILVRSPTSDQPTRHSYRQSGGRQRGFSYGLSRWLGQLTFFVAFALGYRPPAPEANITLDQRPIMH